MTQHQALSPFHRWEKSRPGGQNNRLPHTAWEGQCQNLKSESPVSTSPSPVGTESRLPGPGGTKGKETNLDMTAPPRSRCSASARNLHRSPFLDHTSRQLHASDNHPGHGARTGAQGAHQQSQRSSPTGPWEAWEVGIHRQAHSLMSQAATELEHESGSVSSSALKTLGPGHSLHSLRGVLSSLPVPPNPPTTT